MHPWSPSTDEADDPERGSAAVEFILAGLVLLVPLVYLVVALATIQSHSLGAQAGARHVARAIATAESLDEARLRADSVFEAVASEYGLDLAATDLAFVCTPAGGDCPRAGAVLSVRVDTQVALPLVPPVLGLEDLAVVPIEATAVQRVSRLWGAP